MGQKELMPKSDAVVWQDKVKGGTNCPTRIQDKWLHTRQMRSLPHNKVKVREERKTFQKK